MVPALIALGWDLKSVLYSEAGRLIKPIDASQTFLYDDEVLLSVLRCQLTY